MTRVARADASLPAVNSSCRGAARTGSNAFALRCDTSRPVLMDAAKRESSLAGSAHLEEKRPAEAGHHGAIGTARDVDVFIAGQEHVPPLE